MTSCIYCDARSDAPLCEECRDVLDAHRFARRAAPRKVSEPFHLADFMSLARACAAEYGLPVSDMLARPRGDRATFSARVKLYEAMWGKGLTVIEIGRWCGRDHSTVSSALKAVRAKG